MAANGITIKDAQLVERATGNEKIPVSDGSGLPKGVLVEQIKAYSIVGMATSEELKSKQDLIDDLDAIREGAALGATALQEHQDISGKLDKTEAESTFAKKQDVEKKQDIINDLEEIRKGSAKGSTSVQPGELANVAKSGSYNDLSDKPSIPSAVTEETVSDWGFTKNKGDYSKPANGIPKSDLEDNVQSSLNKADSALQEEIYKGTICAVDTGEGVEEPDGNYVTKSELDNAIAQAITRTLNTDV